MGDTENTINLLYNTLLERKTADTSESYTAKLYKRGGKQIAKKMGEEAVELVIEAVNLEEKPKSKKRRTAFKNETADLIYHVLVLLSYNEIAPDEIFEILQNRMGVSGIEEKANRKTG